MADPTISIANVGARDTEHDSPSQILAWPNGHWPMIDQITSVIGVGSSSSASGTQSLGEIPTGSYSSGYGTGSLGPLPQPPGYKRPPGYKQTGPLTLDRQNKSTTGYFGGAIPATSGHWLDFFKNQMGISPTGSTSAFIANPDPTGVVDAVAHSQNGSSGNGGDFWSVLQTTFRGAWRKNAPNNSYKSG